MSKTSFKLKLETLTRKIPGSVVSKAYYLFNWHLDFDNELSTNFAQNHFPNKNEIIYLS